MAHVRRLRRLCAQFSSTFTTTGTSAAATAAAPGTPAPRCMYARKRFVAELFGGKMPPQTERNSADITYTHNPMHALLAY